MSPNNKTNSVVVPIHDYQSFRSTPPIINSHPTPPCSPKDSTNMDVSKLESQEKQFNNNVNDNKSSKKKSQPPVRLICYQKHNDGVVCPENGDLSKDPIPVNSEKVNGTLNEIKCDKGYVNEGFDSKLETTDKLNRHSPTDNSGGRIPYSNNNSTTSLVHINGDCVKDDGNGGDNEDGTESLYAMTLQVFVPFLIAGFGMVGAGLVLDQVQHWEVFEKITAIYIVVPPLLGLKGNLEMTLASRLSTLANLGIMDSTKSKLKFIGGNMVISQCLASLIGLLTALLAVFIGFLQDPSGYNQNHSLVLIASGVATAAASSCILDSIMVMVILLSRRYGINPDNVATPIAASLGDITTTGLLAGIGTALYSVIDKITWVGPLVFGMFLILLPLWYWIARREPYTYDALKTTCVPVIGAMILSTGGGFILKIAVKIYVDLAVFQPIINGVGGNLVAIQASRIATSLHRTCTKGILPSTHPTICISPFSVFFGRDKHVRCAQILILMVIPGQLIFIYTTSFISTGRAALSAAFVCVYLFAALLQVALLLYIATIITYLVWRYKIDPDNFSIPLLTALGDLLGIGLLALAFLFLEAVGERVAFINT